MENEKDIYENEEKLKKQLKMDIRYCFWDNYLNVPVFCMLEQGFPIGEVRLYRRND